MVRTDSFLSSCPSDRPAHPGADQLSRTAAPALLAPGTSRASTAGCKPWTWVPGGVFTQQ